MIDASRAHNNRGVAYSIGLGVTQDYVRAYKWFSLAAAGGNEHGAKNRDFTAKEMNLAQLAKAKIMVWAWAWTEKYKKKQLS